MLLSRNLRGDILFDVSFPPSHIPFSIKWLISTLSDFEICFLLQLNLNILLCNHQLKKIVTALPRRLVVFVTHHHHDHVDGKSLLKL